MHRRDFLKRAALAGGAITLGGATVLGCDDDDDRSGTTGAARSLTAVQPSDSPIDTIVVVTMENRSFDHYLGWLGGDAAYREHGRKRYGRGFHVDARTDLAFQDASGAWVATQHLTTSPVEPDPYRGCGHPVPGHSWKKARRELDAGFIAEGTGNDSYALGYYRAGDLPVTAHLARRFTVCDRSFPSILGPTFPNRQYLHAATSEGWTTDPGPLKPGTYTADTIWKKLIAAGVPCGYYYSDCPVLLMYGEGYKPIIHTVDDFFDDCEQGTLPNVVYVEPKFGGPFRTDDHSDGDVRLGQRFILDVFRAFAQSKYWERGAFVLTYDEWGGFFDHVRPPILQDGERIQVYTPDTFQQTGFRIPTVVASPYAPRGGVDHTTYDHTSILRFIEWRFLGAPEAGPGGDHATWYLTRRDRHANNLGGLLVDADPDVDLDFDTDVEIPPATAACTVGPPRPADPELAEPDPFTLHPLMQELLDTGYPPAAYAPHHQPGAIAPAAPPETPTTTTDPGGGPPVTSPPPSPPTPGSGTTVG